jgi:hypothetical protein
MLDRSASIANANGRHPEQDQHAVALPPDRLNPVDDTVYDVSSVWAGDPLQHFATIA